MPQSSEVIPNSCFLFFLFSIMLKVVGSSAALTVPSWVFSVGQMAVGKARAPQVANICVYRSNKKHQFPGLQTYPFLSFRGSVPPSILC